MSSAMLLERSGLSFPGYGSPALGGQPSPTSAPGTNWCVVPRCELKVEKCQGGMKIHCKCDDEVACGTLQNLCKMLAGGMCSCCCTFNGIPCCQCNLACGITKCECTKDGVCITCTSGDKTCCEMIQSCCECISTMCKSGCCCYICFNNTPVCCGTC
ncbi:MAG: hypothetical protein HYX69_20360 [Planctomycetia bacterium]|nr:hypothetical protein [Planctomycetia bacterium]